MGVITDKIMRIATPVTPPDFRNFEERLVCQCKVSGNLVKQYQCANFLYNTHSTRCVFNKIGNGFLDFVCDVTSESYDCVVYFNGD